MESEKVKEIKKALECCKNRDCWCCKRLDNAPHEELDCRLVLLTDILTLINELESENDCKDIEISKQEYQIKQLKDRIAELENCDYYKKLEKKKEDLLCKEYGLMKYEKEIIGKHLKQFAEKLKEKFNRQEERFATDVTRFENDLDKVKESDLPTAKYLIGKATGQATMAEKAQYYTDETLKEFVNE